MNLGGIAEDQKRWYPANKLKIVEWQNVAGKVHSDFTKTMLAAAKRNPDVNKQLITDHALPALGIEPLKFLLVI